MLSSRLFLVAPHSFCNEKNKIRHCDRYAGAAVDALKRAGGSRVCGVHVSDTFRKSDFDYNRPMTNKMPWRNRLRDLITRTRPTFVLEVHSFPGNHPFYKHWDHADLVLYRSSINTNFVEELQSRIATAAPNLTIGIQSPDHPVAITDDMIKMGIDHTLFEFNEDMPASNLKVLSQAIISVFDNWPIKKVGGFAPILTALKKYWLIIVIVIIVFIVLVFRSMSSTQQLFQQQVESH
jgi:hypothetical protein